MHLNLSNCHLPHLVTTVPPPLHTAGSNADFPPIVNVKGFGEVFRGPSPKEDAAPQLFLASVRDGGA